MLKIFCKKLQTAVVIGVIPEMDCLQEAERNDYDSIWMSAIEAKKYTFDEDQTVFVFSNIAKACSKAAQEWYKQQNISVFIFVTGNIKFDLLALGIFSGLLPKKTEIIKLQCPKSFEINISQFFKDLKEQIDKKVIKSLSSTNLQSVASSPTESYSVPYTRKGLMEWAAVLLKDLIGGVYIQEQVRVKLSMPV